MQIADEYKLLFLEICKSMQRIAEVTAEKMETPVTLQMRDKYQRLEDKLDKKESLDHKDIIELYAGSLCIQEALKGKMKRLQISLSGYQDLLDPKLKTIINDRIQDSDIIENFFNTIDD